MSIDFSYGHWGTVIFLSALWIAFTYLLTPTRTFRQRMVFIFFALFLIEQFVELYGYPYSLGQFPQQLAQYRTPHLLGNRAGDLWRILLNLDDAKEAIDVFHLFGGIFIFGGLGLLTFAWWALRPAQALGIFATTGPYAAIRHPQCVAYIMMMIGYLIQAPTLPTLILFPFISGAHVWLAFREEQDALSAYGQVYANYMKATARFLPKR